MSEAEKRKEDRVRTADEAASPASGSGIRMTEAQKRIVEAAPGNILVSAAAGSGKTFVMTERIIRRISAGELSLDAALILTFTNAAAAGMERKIRQRLEETLDAARRAGDEALTERLEEQTLALQQAHISTIHAFCLWLIRNFPHEVRDEDGTVLLEPDFQTLDPQAADELKEEALAEVMDEAYKKAERGEPGSETFFTLLDAYGGTKSDRPLRELISAVHDYLRSLPDYRAFVAGMREDLKRYVRDFAASPHMAYLLREFRLRLQRTMQALPGLKRALAAGTIAFTKSEETNREYYEMFSAWIGAAETCDAALSAWEEEGGAFEAWDALYLMVSGLEWKKPRISKTDPPEKAAFTDAFVEAFADFTACFGMAKGALKKAMAFPELPLFTARLEEHEEAMQRTEKVIGLFFDLVLALDTRYQAMKFARRAVDFADYEHFALRILEREDGLDFCRSRFPEVYIDEYQDTSSIQEALLQKICPGQLFMVGDVKQSIYRFRHARPETFLKKAEAYAAGEGGTYLSLNRNFRSQTAILRLINEVFCRLMTKAFTGIDYIGRTAETGGTAAAGTGHAMVPGREDALKPERCALWLQKTDQAVKSLNDRLEEEERDRLFSRIAARYGAGTAYRLLEADKSMRMYAFVASEILRLHAEEHVPYRDIAVMARGNMSCDIAASLFTTLGIPQNRKKPAAVSESYPLQLQLALMQSLDNVRRDIPLATLLLSELSPVPFTERDAVKLRILQREKGEKGCLYEALKTAAEEEDDLGRKAAAFLERLEQWRLRETHLSAKELLREIWFETDYLPKLQRDDGPEGTEALESFSETLTALEQQGRVGLHQVLSYFEEEMESGNQETAENDYNGDGVQIMTFHKSKGLEFPYVFLLDLDARLEDKDKRRRLIISEDLGAGFDAIGESGKVTYPSLLRLAMEGEKRQRYLTEEICLLYVAMSRAEEKLYLCLREDYKEGAAKTETLAFLLKEADKASSPALPSYVLQGVKSYQDMLLSALWLLPYPAVRRLFSELQLDNNGAEDPADNSSAIQQMQLAQSRLTTEKAGIRDDNAERGMYLQVFDDTEDYEALLRRLLSERREEQEEDAADAFGDLEAYKKVSGDLYDFYAFDKQFKALPKQSVSEIKRQSQKRENTEEDEDYGEINLNIRSLDEVRQELQEKKLSAAEAGITVHKALRFLQPADFTAVRDEKEGDEKVARRLKAFYERGIFTAEEYAALQDFIPALRTFLLSDTARMIAAAEKKEEVFRELPFTFRYQEEEKESLIQGIIDLWFRYEGKHFLLDFKTDRLPENRAEARALLAARYRIQMKLYASALEAGTGETLEHCIIWSVRRGEGFRFSRTELFQDV